MENPGIMELILGMFIGFTIGLALYIGRVPVGNTELTKCAETHNVYACHYEAVPTPPTQDKE